MPEPEHWYSRIQKRLGHSGPIREELRSSTDMGPPMSPGRPDHATSSSSGHSLPASALAHMAQQTSAIADSVNIIDHQFKVSILGRVGSLEKEVSVLKELCERNRDCLKGIEQKLQWRKGVPCDMLERLDSMVNFTYAFCKSMEDAGLFQMKKK